MQINKYLSLLATSALLSLSACSGDDSNDTSAATDGSTTDASTTDASTTGDPTGDPTGSTSDATGSTTAATDSGGSTTAATGSTGGGVDHGYCAQGCVEDADCCPAGSLNCPGEAYPDNYTCVEGICEFGGCSTNEECTMGGILMGYECHPISEVGSCFEPCEADDDCALVPGTTCTGEADDGAKYCKGEDVPACESDEDCANGVCDLETGICGCTDDESCSDETYNTCVMP